MSSPQPQPKLPRRIAPADFYGEYLPALWAWLTGGVELPWPSWSFAVGFHISGAGEEPYPFTLRFEAGRLHLTEASDGGPHEVEVRTDLESWDLAVQSVLRDVLRHVSRNLPSAQQALTRFLVERGGHLTVADFTALPGRIRISYTDDAGDQGTYTLAVGDTRSPCAHIFADHTDLRALLTAEGRLLRLLKGLRVEGDMGYLLRLAALLAAE